MIEGIGFLCACIVALWGGCYGSGGAQHGIGVPVGKVNVVMGLLALLAFVMVWVGGTLRVGNDCDPSVGDDCDPSVGDDGDPSGPEAANGVD